ncbi:hypothetical protein Tco_0079445 [Tanacetum coccineum]
MECVTTTSYSICVNGSLHGYFRGKRGLRQGDPLSPYLFILIMEVLTLMLQRRVHDSQVFTYHRFCSKLELINLCFVDDLFLFAYGDVHSASIIKEALEEFEGASGLTPSLPKSTAYFCNVLNHVKLSILQIPPFEEGKLLVKYLEWKNKSLSAAGHLQLIRSVLGAMHIYWASVFILPSRVLLNIEQLVRGGLGIRRLEVFNYALMIADIWKLLSLKESLWVKWIHEYKLKGHRDGAATSLWFDKWCEMGPLANLISSHDIFRAGLSHTSKVRDLIQDSAWNWPQDLLSKYLFLSICHVSLVVSRSDCLVWRNSQGVSKPFLVAQHAFNLWLVVKRKLKTQDLISILDVSDSLVWDRMKGLAGLDSSSPNIYVIIIGLIPIASRRSILSLIAKLVVAASAYYIWQERNWHLFKNCKKAYSDLWFFPIGVIGYVIEKEAQKLGKRLKRVAGSYAIQKSPKKSKVMKSAKDVTEEEAAECEKEKEELRLSLKIISNDDSEVNYEPLSRKFPIVNWEYQLLGKMEEKDMYVYKLTRADKSSSYHGDTQAFLRRLDRQDLNDLYRLVQERFQDHPLEGHDLLLWGDLRMIFDPDEKDEL